MELRLQRDISSKHATIGALRVDGAFECFTLEDVVRERAGEPVEAWKIHGETAIPAGRYRVRITPSARFGRALPLLGAVPGFAGVRIHPGNTAADTEGCILVGAKVAIDTVVESRSTFARLFEKLEAAIGAGADVWITIKSAEA